MALESPCWATTHLLTGNEEITSHNLFARILALPRKAAVIA